MVDTNPRDVILRRIGKGLSALVILVVNAVGVLLALFVDAMRCDEGCSDQPLNWHENVDAWQWDAQLAVAGIGVLASLLAILAIARGRSAAVPVLVASLVAWAIWWAWVTGF